MHKALHALATVALIAACGSTTGQTAAPTAAPSVTLADTICAPPAYAGCRGGVPLLEGLDPGALIAVCDYGNGSGDLVWIDSGKEASVLRDSFEKTGLFLAELREFREELLRVAGLPYKPNLDDGVLVTASPLWKLFRLPKWRRDLKACWDDLEGGGLEWAQLAHSMWPDRIRDLCRRDRSLAIVHELEDICEVSLRPERGNLGEEASARPGRRRTSGSRPPRSGRVRRARQ
jgi:hypothetical protein